MDNDASTPSSSKSNVPTTDEAALKDKELLLKEREITLKEQEAKAKIELDKRSLWFSSPLLIGALSAIFGLIGTGIGASLQGYSNFQLERQKFESSLIQKSLEIKDRNEAAKSLLFLVDSGIIQSLDNAKIRKIAEDPEQLPALTQLLAASSNSGVISLSPDGKTIAVGNRDKTVTIWTIDGVLIGTLLGHTNSVTSVVYSPDGQTLFSGSLDNTVKMWDRSGRLLRTFEMSDEIIGIAIAPNGKMLIVRTPNQIFQWDIAAGKLTRVLKLSMPPP